MGGGQVHGGHGVDTIPHVAETRRHRSHQRCRGFHSWGSWYVRLKVASGEKKIRLQSVDFLKGRGQRRRETAFDSELFNFSSEADAKRAANALKHAITLCGDKPGKS